MKQSIENAKYHIELLDNLINVSQGGISNDLKYLIILITPIKWNRGEL